MDILYLLVPVSVLLVLALMALFYWALDRGQFDDLEREAERILEMPPTAVVSFRLDEDQGPPAH
jgi:cbb3-type cytochrome oxidase maturation protein